MRFVKSIYLESIRSTHLVLVLSVLLYLILLPALHFKMFLTPGLYNEKRWVQLGLFFILAVVLMSNNNFRNRIVNIFNCFPVFIKIFLLVILILGAISSITSNFPIWAFLEYSHHLLIGVNVLLFAVLAQINPVFTKKVIVLAVVGTVFFYLVRFFNSYIFFLMGEFPRWPGNGAEIRLFGFGNIRIFNHIQTWTLPLLTVFIWHEWHNNKIKKYGYFLMAGFWWMLVIAAGARGTAISVLVSFGIIWFAIRPGSFSLVKVFIPSIFTGGFLFVLFYKLNTSTAVSVRSLSRKGTGERYEMWGDLIPDILIKPIIGYGPMHFAEYINGLERASPHNWFLQFSYEWGIPAALLLLFIFCYAFYHAFHKIKEKVSVTESNVLTDNYLEIGLVWSCLAAFLHSFLSGILISPLSQVWLILIAGTTIGLLIKIRGSEIIKIDIWKNRMLSILIIFGLSGILVWGIKYDMNSDNFQSEYLKNSEPPVLAPRYWQQGKIGLKEFLDKPARYESINSK